MWEGQLVATSVAPANTGFGNSETGRSQRAPGRPPRRTRGGPRVLPHAATGLTEGLDDSLGADGESLEDIEVAIGSTYADILIGTHRGSRLVGLEDSDHLFGNGGSDRLDDRWSSSSVASS
jgi:hypothetical protein